MGLKKEGSSALDVKGNPGKVKLPKKSKKKPWYLMTMEELTIHAQNYLAGKKALLEAEGETVVPSDMPDKIDAALKRMAVLAGKAGTPADQRREQERAEKAGKDVSPNKIAMTVQKLEKLKQRYEELQKDPSAVEKPVHAAPEEKTEAPDLSSTQGILKAARFVSDTLYDVSDKKAVILAKKYPEKFMALYNKAVEHKKGQAHVGKPMAPKGSKGDEAKAAELKRLHSFFGKEMPKYGNDPAKYAHDKVANWRNYSIDQLPAELAQQVKADAVARTPSHITAKVKKNQRLGDIDKMVGGLGKETIDSLNTFIASPEGQQIVPNLRRTDTQKYRTAQHREKKLAGPTANAMMTPSRDRRERLAGEVPEKDIKKMGMEPELQSAFKKLAQGVLDNPHLQDQIIDKLEDKTGIDRSKIVSVLDRIKAKDASLINDEDPEISGLAKALPVLLRATSTTDARRTLGNSEKGDKFYNSGRFKDAAGDLVKTVAAKDGHSLKTGEDHLDTGVVTKQGMAVMKQILGDNPQGTDLSTFLIKLRTDDIGSYNKVVGMMLNSLKDQFPEAYHKEVRARKEKSVAAGSRDLKQRDRQDKNQVRRIAASILRKSGIEDADLVNDYLAAEPNLADLLVRFGAAETPEEQEQAGQNVKAAMKRARHRVGSKLSGVLGQAKPATDSPEMSMLPSMDRSRLRDPDADPVARRVKMALGLSDEQIASLSPEELAAKSEEAKHILKNRGAERAYTTTAQNMEKKKKRIDALKAAKQRLVRGGRPQTAPQNIDDLLNNASRMYAGMPEEDDMPKEGYSIAEMLIGVDGKETDPGEKEVSWEDGEAEKLTKFEPSAESGAMMLTFANKKRSK